MPLSTILSRSFEVYDCRRDQIGVEIEQNGGWRAIGSVQALTDHAGGPNQDRGSPTAHSRLAMDRLIAPDALPQAPVCASSIARTRAG